MGEPILVVEDEEELRATVEYNLGRAGHVPTGTRSGREAIRMAAALHPALVLLDLNLPDISGFEVCRQLRAEPVTRAVPIVVLSARDGEVDRVVALEIGADDYVVKPFSVRELLLRIDALLRRSGPPRNDAGIEPLQAGPLAIDRGQRRCMVEGAEIPLSATEFDLLRTLMERPGRVQTRERLLVDVWQSAGEIGVRTVDTHVKRLRSKLGNAGDLIRTVRGVGYSFEIES
jgi:two-component system phosphate regulon response regulator PhoB